MKHFLKLIANAILMKNELIFRYHWTFLMFFLKHRYCLSLLVFCKGRFICLWEYLNVQFIKLTTTTLLNVITSKTLSNISPKIIMRFYGIIYIPPSITTPSIAYLLYTILILGDPDRAALTAVTLHHPTLTYHCLACYDMPVWRTR